MENTSRFPAPRNNGGILSWYSVLTHAWCRLFLFIRAYPSWCSVLTHCWNIVLAYSRNPPFAPFLLPTLLANPPARIPRALTTSHQSPWNNYTFHLPRVLNSTPHHKITNPLIRTQESTSIRTTIASWQWISCFQSPSRKYSSCSTYTSNSIPHALHHNNSIPRAPHHNNSIPHAPHHNNSIPHAPHHNNSIPRAPHHNNSFCDPLPPDQHKM